jgi:GcrA cell cycle regulator
MVWDEEQIARLKKHLESGSSIIRTAAALGRSSGSVQTKARQLGLPYVTARNAKRLRNAKIQTAQKLLERL